MPGFTRGHFELNPWLGILTSQLSTPGGLSPRVRRLRLLIEVSPVLPDQQYQRISHQRAQFFLKKSYLCLHKYFMNVKVQIVSTISTPVFNFERKIHLKLILDVFLESSKDTNSQFQLNRTLRTEAQNSTDGKIVVLLVEIVTKNLLFLFCARWFLKKKSSNLSI